MGYRIRGDRGGPAAVRVLGLASLVCALMFPGPSPASSIDSDLRAAMASLARGGDIDATLSLLERASRDSPGLGAAHLLRADVYGLLAGLPMAEGLSRADGPTNMGTRESRLRPSADVEALREELRARAAWLSRAEGSLPLNVLNLEPGIDHVILIDLSAPRVFLLARTGESLSVSAEYYGSVGSERGGKTQEGDMRTPVGAYRIQAELSGRALRSYHGPLALVLDYPNAADRSAGRTGSHIWIHGVPPGVAARPPFSTEGCVALANSDLLSLRRAVRIERTKVVIVERTEWVSEAVWRSARAEAVAAAPRSTLVSLGPASPIMGMQRNGRINLAVAPPISMGAVSDPALYPNGVSAPPLKVEASVVPVRDDSGLVGMEPRARAQTTTAPLLDSGLRRLTAANPATIRREPRGEVIGTIARGETLEVLMEVPGGWLLVQAGARKGFVHTMNLNGS